MQHTKIEWCDSTVNPTENCDGCELWSKGKGGECYAGRFTERVKGKGAFDKPPVLKHGRMAEAAKWPDLRGIERPDKPWIPGEMPRIIFLGDMADIFSRDVPFEFLKQEIIDVVNSPDGQRHIWMLLTKQARRLVEFDQWLEQRCIAWPDNLWAGVSVTMQATLWRVRELLKLRTKYLFVSYEPAREYVRFDGVMRAGLDLIIIGGASGSKQWPFNVEWARKTIADCSVTGTACFVKQLGSIAIESFPDPSPRPSAEEVANFQRAGWCRNDFSLVGGGVNWTRHLYLYHSKGGDWAEWPESLRVRQFPKPCITS